MMKINFYATYRQAVGGKTVTFETPEGTTVRTLVDEIVTRYPRLRGEMLDEAGQLYRHVHVFINGRDARYLPDGLDTRLAAADVVNIFPPVAGG